MEVFNLNSLYISLFILCVFIATVLFICCKLIRQDSRIDALYQPQVIRPEALERPHRPMAKLRKPKNRNFTSKGTQTLNVNSVHAAFQKSSISNQKTLSETPTISNIEEEIKIESVQLFTTSPDFYENPSAACVSVERKLRICTLIGNLLTQRFAYAPVFLMLILISLLHKKDTSACEFIFASLSACLFSNFLQAWGRSFQTPDSE